jgi:fructosamine-3-kinase
MISAGLQAEIERAIKSKINAIAPLSAANNAQIYRIALAQGGVLVAKVAERGLDIEAWMLGYLKTKTKLPVPAVVYSNDYVIVMEFIPSQHMLDDACQVHAAELLAELHGIRSEQFGLERDTLIGALRQPNAQNRDWPAFYAEQRLIYMAGEALREKRIDAKMVKQVEKLAGRLPALLKDYAPPSLIHGDIWGGNILAGRGKIAAFLDPAIYYADPEAELAFIKLFNTCGDAFFRRYNELRPIRPGFFEERADIYNLYPLLVHARLFGISYARKAQRILERFE